jgi:signal transduction histidine kinase
MMTKQQHPKHAGKLAGEDELRFHVLSDISHEFRTPLSTLNASIELLMQEADTLTPDELRELLHPTQVSLVTLQTLVNNLLESSRIEAGRFVPHLQTLQIGQLIANASRIVWPLLQRRRQQLRLELPVQATTIRGDEEQLTQVMVNLLTNAAKYSPAAATIDAAVRSEAAAIVVEVADRGPGVPVAQRPYLFDRFVRFADAAGEANGMGLGLYVARSAVEAHGGQIGMDERPGGGSRFWFRLPDANAGGSA